jgi:hypothetical protein
MVAKALKYLKNGVEQLRSYYNNLEELPINTSFPLYRSIEGDPSGS